MNGMKKNRILGVVGIVALALLLGACRFSVEPIRAISNATWGTDWELGSDSYVICENFDSTVWFSAVAESPQSIVRVEQIYVGKETDEVLPRIVTAGSALSFDGNGRFVVGTEFNSANQAPLAVQGFSDDVLEPSAIVIIPIDPNDPDPAGESGVTQARFEVVVETAVSGVTRRFSYPSANTYYDIPVWGGCQIP